MEPISPFKLIIAGSRKLHIKWDAIDTAIKIMEIPYPTEIVCGMATGPDTSGRLWACDHGIPVKEFPPNWKKFGRKAGIVRNEEMGAYADGLLAFWDSKSRGTKHMIDYMLAQNDKYTFVVYGSYLGEKPQGLAVADATRPDTLQSKSTT